MDAQAVQRVLMDLPRYGRVIKDRFYRQTWRFEISGRAVYLKFYPHRENRWRRLVRGSSAMREFLRLQWLQKAKIPTARAVSVLMGLTIAGRRGDGLLIEGIEPSITLHELVRQWHLTGEPVANHRDIVKQVIAILQTLTRARLGHTDLHLGNFLLHNGKVHLIDACSIHRGGLNLRDIMRLAANAEGAATRSDLLRGWWSLGGGRRVPRRNPQTDRVYRKRMSQIMSDSSYFARFRSGDWVGVSYQRFPEPRAWSRFSQLEFDEGQWEAAWPRLHAMIESGQFTVIKESRGGDVLQGQVVVGGRPLDVVVKRALRGFWYRHLTEPGRGTRAHRAWVTSWRLIQRDVPCAWPAMLMERRKLRYATETLIVFERIPGRRLSAMDLDSLDGLSRRTLFHRCGAALRRMEAAGMYHWDCNSSNWMVNTASPAGATPMLADVDGVRSNRGIGEGIRGLLESMREHPQYTPEDSLNLCRGYAPFAPTSLP